jgi:uncharacterized protein YcbK (DUF882 family)
MSTPARGLLPPDVSASTFPAVWDMIRPHFSRAEFKHPDLMSAKFLAWLYDVRESAQVPLRIRSDYRDPAANAAAGGARGSAHMQLPCRAVDLTVRNNLERYAIVAAAIRLGCRRIGIYPATAKGAGALHLDLSQDHPHGRIWTSY